MTIVAVSNQKGGVGKTTTTVSLSSALTMLGYRVLMVDLDPQCNATVAAGISLSKVTHSICDALIHPDSVHNDMLVSTKYHFDVLCGSHKLTGVEVQLMQEAGREFRLREALSAWSQDYHFVLIDCPPALNVLTINALVASEKVLIPCQCEYLALEGLSKLLKTITALNQSLGTSIQICGLVRTLFDGRNLLSRQVSHQLAKSFGSILYDSIIPRNVKLAEAPSHGTPIGVYDSKSQGAAAYFALAHEMSSKLVGQREKKMVEQQYA